MMGRRSKHVDHMDARTAVEIADGADLPDGAYFAMVGDLMGGDYMDGIEAVLHANGEAPMHKPPVDLPSNQIHALEPFGRIVRCDPHHYQIRDGKNVVADFWPNAKKPKWRVGKDGIASIGSPLDLATALAGDRASAEILKRASASEILTALVNCVEHMEHSTDQGRKAYNDAKKLISRTGVWK